jgi:hypothetical protein
MSLTPLPTNVITSLPSFEAVPSFRLVSSLAARPDGTVFVTQPGGWRDWDRWALTEVESVSTEEASVFGIHSMRHRGQRLGLGFGQPVLRVGREDDIALTMYLRKMKVTRGLPLNRWRTLNGWMHLYSSLVAMKRKFH